jgi:hypothetical protein
MRETSPSVVTGDILYSRRSSIVSVSPYAMRETSPVVAEEIFYTLGEVV